MAAKSGAKRGAGKGAAKKGDANKSARGSGRRELLTPRGHGMYGKRGKKGEFSEMDNVGPSLRRDRQQRAKKTVNPGYGDQGDQRRRSRRKSAGKKS